MEKMDYAKGLIRYTSGRAITEGMTQSQVRKRMLRPRVLAYSFILLLIMVGFVVSLATRTTLRMDVIRDRIDARRHHPVDAAKHGILFVQRSEEHTSELQSLMRISYAVFVLKTNNEHKLQYT